MVRRISWMVAGSLMLLGAVATAQGPKAPPEKEKFDSLVVALAQIVKARVTASTGAICIVDPATECTVTVSSILYLGRNYCLVEAPDVVVRGTSSAAKFIDWKLDRTDLLGGSLEFHGEAGVVTIVDAPPALIDKNNRGHGKGGGATAPKHLFHVKTNRHSQVRSAGYLPVVLWDPVGRGEWELCAAIDPRIVNVP